MIFWILIALVIGVITLELAALKREEEREQWRDAPMAEKVRAVRAIRETQIRLLKWGTVWVLLCLIGALVTWGLKP